MVKLNVPADGSIVPHGMSSSAVVSPSAFNAAKEASDQAAPCLSKSSWVDHIGVVGDVLDDAAICVAACERPASEPAIRLPATIVTAAIAASHVLGRARRRCGAGAVPGCCVGRAARCLLGTLIWLRLPFRQKRTGAQWSRPQAPRSVPDHGWDLDSLIFDLAGPFAQL